jgi:hypothetical protein
MTKANDINQKQPKKRGGARPGSGRPSASKTKISGTSIMAALEKHLGRSYEDQLALNYAICQAKDDRAMIAKYDQMFLNKVVGDLANLDVTTGGEAIKGAFTFLPQELKDWTDDK